jgi:hypothetical protein
MKPLTRLAADPTSGAISVQFIFSEALTSFDCINFRKKELSDAVSSFQTPPRSGA